MRAVLGLVLLGVVAIPCAAQHGSRTVHDAMVWGGIFGDHRIAPKTALYWDYQGRRAEVGSVWQINLGAVGITRDLSPRWRTTAALGWSRGYRSGEFPARTNSFEVRPWVQINGTRPVGSWTWSDRTRAEFRVLRPIGELAPQDADWAPTVVRMRRQDKFQHPLRKDGTLYFAGSQEFLVNVHPATSRVAMLEQSRTQLVIGRQLTQRNRAEVGYGLQRFNRRGGYEMNHTLLLYFRTSTPIR